MSFRFFSTGSFVISSLMSLPFRPFLGLIHSLLLVAGLFQFANGQVVISEFLASNSGASVLDEDGDDPDWIEIWNSGESAVFLDGYSLTDDASDLGQWVFPAITLGAGEFLLRIRIVRRWWESCTPILGCQRGESIWL